MVNGELKALGVAAEVTPLRDGVTGFGTTRAGQAGVSLSLPGGGEATAYVNVVSGDVQAHTLPCPSLSAPPLLFHARRLTDHSFAAAACRRTHSRCSARRARWRRGGRSSAT